MCHLQQTRGFHWLLFCFSVASSCNVDFCVFSFRQSCFGNSICWLHPTLTHSLRKRQVDRRHSLLLKILLKRVVSRLVFILFYILAWLSVLPICYFSLFPQFSISFQPPLSLLRKLVLNAVFKCVCMFFLTRSKLFCFPNVWYD